MKWISVKERLPDTNEEFGESDYVLCYTEFREQVVCWYRKNNEWVVANFKADSTPLNIAITHWMPLLEPPSEPTITQNDDCCGRCDNINDFCIRLDEDYQP